MSLDDSDLVFVPLGGAGQIGMNMYLYGHGRGAKRRWIMVDCGVSFGDMETSPGIELVMPDPSFIAARKEQLVGIFLTHAHEDHIGALGRLWPRLQAPVYARPFTALHIRRKFEEAGLSQKPIKVVDGLGPVEAGPFSVRFQPVTHSIPETSAFVIDTPAGRIVHTADFKVDADPQLGPPFDHAAFERIGEEGVQAMVCDSTNVFLEGHGGSEAEVLGPLADAIRSCKGAVAATTFASNVARLRGLAQAASQSGRAVVLVGRSIQRMVEAAQDTGELRDFPSTIGEDEAKRVPAEHLFYLVTGSQGEARAALARIANGSHPTVRLGEGDAVIFSSKTIPGNEAGVIRIWNDLSERGVRVIDEHSPGLTGRIHVSGHARREDLADLYRAVKPRLSVPMHGEHRHLMEHARFVRDDLGVPSLPAPNGTVLDISGDRPEILDEVETGLLYLDGETLIGALDGVVRTRLRLARQGLVICSLVVDETGDLLADPEIRIVGGPETAEDWPKPLEEMLYESVDDAIEGLPRKKRADADIEDAAARAIRRIAGRRWGKKPSVEVLITRLEDE
ncbi:MAG TPA: ribonuclease J [Paracoccaceae bacterium]|nr:ribonuclease J [Paracoccaceae bacterium]